MPQPGKISDLSPAQEQAINTVNPNPDLLYGDVDNLFERRNTCRVNYQGLIEFDVVYRPDSLTPLTELRIREASQNGEWASGMLVEMICNIVVDWGLRLKGRVVPLEFDALTEVPSGVLNKVLETVNEHSRPNPGRSRGSWNGSGRRGG